MTVLLSPIGNSMTPFLGLDTLPLGGGLLYTYQAGSTTALATYTGVDGLIPCANPIVLGTDGKIPSELWLLYGYSYKFVLQTATSVAVATYDNISGILTTIPTATPSIPTGCILLWSGSTGSIPSGFLLCDGTNGTPDLRNSFVLGAGNSYTVGQTGGSTDAIVVSHTHSATVTDPGHNHLGSVYNYYNGASGSNGFISGINQLTATTTSVTGISVTNQSTGTSATNANMPPYYALAYIQKT